jgi:hypothetical protein
MQIGKMQTATLFDATHAIVVQNQDQIDIPLVLEQIPSAKQVLNFLLLFGLLARSLMPQDLVVSRCNRIVVARATTFRKTISCNAGIVFVQSAMVLVCCHFLFVYAVGIVNVCRLHCSN